MYLGLINFLFILINFSLIKSKYAFIENNNVLQFKNNKENLIYKFNHNINFDKDIKKFNLNEDLNNYETFSSRKSKCGYNSCNPLKKNAINVHLVPHTHDDVGWLKTVDQYYYGNKNFIQRAGVQYIIDSVIDELLKNDKRRFIYVESAFFKKWWIKQNLHKKKLLRKLVKEGRFEFIGGGWSMNDEATAHYISIINQMTLGHQFLQSEFGKCGIPKIAWQIDPFGHSREQASLFAQMNFDGLFFGRLDYNDKIKREKELNMEFIWEGNDDLGKESDLFTGVLPNGYNPPEGFCFDDTCADEPIIDDKNSPDYNLDKIIKNFLTVINHQANVYKTNNLIMTMGSDFQYQNALPWFTNLDKLIYYVNKANNSVNLIYSTPSCYLKSLNIENINWNTKNDDFFPYSSDKHSFWSGYFTSRPSFKGFERWASSHLQSSSQLQFLAKLNDENSFNQLNQLKEAIGVSQHHDAITGTEKQHVFSDYVLLLSKAIKASNQLVAKALDILTYNAKISKYPIEFCTRLNISECYITENNNQFILYLYNQLSTFHTFFVRFPINHDVVNVNVLDSNGNEIDCEIVNISKFVQEIPERISNSTKELLFLVHLLPTSVTSYLIKTSKVNDEKIYENRQNDIQSDAYIRNLYHEKSNKLFLTGFNFKLVVDNVTGSTESIILNDGRTFKFKHYYKYYKAMSNETKNRPSGAYIFHPNGTVNLNGNRIVGLNLKESFSEIDVEVNDYIKETIKVYQNFPYIEIDYLIGPIPINDKIGKEIVSVFTTDLQTNKTFYTDSNGRQYLKRVRNERNTYDYDSKVEPIASNYYPITSKVELRDKDLKFVILTDRSQGVSSLKDGELELMLHRRLLYDDGFGVDEALNEPGANNKSLIIRGIHRIFLNNFKMIDDHVPQYSLKMALLPTIAFRKYDQNLNDSLFIKNSKNKKISLLKTELSPCINLLTVDTLKKNYTIIRFQHVYSSKENSFCSKNNFKIDLRNIFENINVTGAIELTLSANQVKGAFQRLKWKKNINNSKNEINKTSSIKDYEKENLRSFILNFTDDLHTQCQLLMNNNLNDFVFTILPSQIRTFILRYKY